MRVATSNSSSHGVMNSLRTSNSRRRPAFFRVCAMQRTDSDEVNGLCKRVQQAAPFTEALSRAMDTK
eukprot:6201560-Pleurochrysis_carterae.AAC.3